MCRASRTPTEGAGEYMARTQVSICRCISRNYGIELQVTENLGPNVDVLTRGASIIFGVALDAGSLVGGKVSYNLFVDSLTDK